MIDRIKLLKDTVKELDEKYSEYLKGISDDENNKSFFDFFKFEKSGDSFIITDNSFLTIKDQKIRDDVMKVIILVQNSTTKA